VPFFSANRQLQIQEPSARAKASKGARCACVRGIWSSPTGYCRLRRTTGEKHQVAHLVDLQFGRCRLSIAVKKSSPYRSALELPPHGRVVSKFVHCAREYFYSLPVEIVPLYGSVELGPITGMSEAIVDLVSTGRTLQENGLIEIETLFESTARLIAHP